LFCEVNPIPVKAAMEVMGFCDQEIRLPLTPMEDANKEKMISLMKGLNLI
jgi:4-hydroxy-tetrahydrodipicolinate synthase